MPRPFPKLWTHFPRAGEVFDFSEQLALRPLLLHWRGKHLKEYMSECARSGRPPGLHMGCASSPIKGWYNCDLRTLSRQVNYVNATERLPFEDHAFQFVFSEHFIEHLSLEEGTKFFKEAFRVLKPGGVIRTATPDLDFVRKLLSVPGGTELRYVDWLVRKFMPAGTPVAPESVINHLFYGWGHRFIYSGEFMIRVLQEVGFRDLKIHKAGHSDSPALVDLEQHGHSVPAEFNELETLVVEGRK